MLYEFIKAQKMLNCLLDNQAAEIQNLVSQTVIPTRGKLGGIWFERSWPTRKIGSRRHYFEFEQK
jgi:hypothetical protein